MNRLAIGIDRVEDSRHPHDQLRQNSPKILHISEEYKESGQNQPDPNVENDQASNGIEEQKELPGKGNAIEGHKSKENQKCKAKIDEG